MAIVSKRLDASARRDARSDTPQGVIATLASLYWNGIGQQPWLCLFSILTINVLLVLGMIFLDTGYGVDYWNLVRDTNAIAGQPFYFGAYSNFGIYLWSIGASVALFTWGSLVKLGIRVEQRRALAFGGLFAAFATIDDLFMLHEQTHLVGVNEIVVFGALGLLMLGLIVTILPVLHRTRWLLLVAALGFMAASMLVDIFMPPEGGGLLIEEGFKLGGIGFMAAYLVTLSFEAWALAVAQARATPDIR
ncbi:MAG: hypothetical protein ACRECW_15390 [Phyllobacterium sp.]